MPNPIVQTAHEAYLSSALFVGLLLPAGACCAETAGEKFFADKVMPQLAKNGCAACHMPARGYVTPAIRYEDLLPYLAMGQAADNNVLIYKLANQRSFAPDRPAHIGGQRCASEKAEPCMSLMRWWEIEFGGAP